jgi:hypothetical protein
MCGRLFASTLLVVGQTNTQITATTRQTMPQIARGLPGNFTFVSFLLRSPTGPLIAQLASGVGRVQPIYRVSVSHPISAHTADLRALE